MVKFWIVFNDRPFRPYGGLLAFGNALAMMVTYAFLSYRQCISMHLILLQPYLFYIGIITLQSHYKHP
jgi:hypothetical protein